MRDLHCFHKSTESKLGGSGLTQLYALQKHVGLDIVKQTLQQVKHQYHYGMLSGRRERIHICACIILRICLSSFPYLNVSSYYGVTSEKAWHCISMEILMQLTKRSKETNLYDNLFMDIYYQTIIGLKQPIKNYYSNHDDNPHNKLWMRRYLRQ